MRRIFATLVPPSSGQRFPALDGLRALAVLSVVAVHTPIVAQFRWLPLRGGVGVCIFFALSAFLLYYPWCKRDLDRAGVISYYRRRLWRIMPAYIVWLALGTIIWYKVYRVFSVGNVAAHFFFLQSFFGKEYARSLISPAWSLPAEIQFYLVLPLLVWLFRKNPLKALLVGLVAALAMQALPPYFPALLGGYSIYGLNWPFMALPFFFGMLAAWWVAHYPGRGKFLGGLGIAGLVAMTLYGDQWFTAHGMKNGLFYACLNPRGLISSVAAMFAIVGLAGEGRSLATGLLSWRGIRLIGIAGYSIFLLHFSLFDLLLHWSGSRSFCAVYGPPLAIVLGIISYLLIEVPTLRYGHKGGKRSAEVKPRPA
jgi:peptidoglycan/LPS O-acetylase OafA/YrhL